jgi:uncharacterized membrane protein YbhN (UPF0104 family)
MFLKKYPKIQNLLKYIKWIWVVVVIIAVVFFLTTRWESIFASFSDIPVSKLLWSASFLIFSKILLVYVTQNSIQKEGITLPYPDVFSIVSFTHLAKYIPGGIWHYVGRLGAYGERDFGIKKSTRALIHENVYLLSGALIIGIVAGSLSSQGKVLFKNFGINISVVALAAVIVLLWGGMLIAYDKIIKPPSKISYIKLIPTLFLAWLSFGLSFGIIFPELSSNNMLLFISVYSIGWLVGYVAIFAPGGIGVRETVLVWMLGGIMDPEYAIIFSAVHRFIFILVEVALGGVSFVLSIRKRTNEKV